MNITTICEAAEDDIEDILRIYNQGIEDGEATLETDTKDISYMKKWFQDHQGRFSVLVAKQNQQIIGWSSLNPYSHRCAYDGVADLSVYIDRDYRGKGIGSTLLRSLEIKAIENGFRKIVLFTLPFNDMGQGLYKKMGYRVVGVFEKQGVIEDQFIDVMIMEKLLLDVHR